MKKFVSFSWHLHRGVVLSLAIIGLGRPKSALAGDDSSKPPSNLVSFSPLYPLADSAGMAATNGLEGYLQISDGSLQLNANTILRPPVCLVAVFNHSTNIIGYLNLSPTMMCALRLVDERGNEVPKTDLGKKFGETLSQKVMVEWRKEWLAHPRQPPQRMFIDIYSNRPPYPDDFPTVLCHLSIPGIFELKRPGRYELHVQIRLVQIGKDQSGSLYYSITELHDSVIMVPVTPKDILAGN